MKERLNLLIKVSRPVFWLVTPVIFMGAIIVTEVEITATVVLQALLLSFPYNLFLYGINDIYDYESDKLNSRKNSIEGAILEPKHHHFIKKAALISVLILLACSLLAMNTSNIVWMSVFIALSYLYSAPPLRIKSVPILDSISNAAIYVILPFMVGYSFSSTSLMIPFKVILVGLGATALHAYTTILDYSSDKAAGVNTIAVVFGKRTAALFSLGIFTYMTFFTIRWENYVNYYLLMCVALSFLAFILPDEKLTSRLSRLFLIGFVITAIFFFLDPSKPSL